MRILVRNNPERLEKSKYIKRWKGKDGKWKYLYRKPSRISPKKEELRDKTNSKNFKEWFNGSKVVNKDGSPKVVYKGMYKEDWRTGNPITSIDSSNGPWAGFFTDKKDVADGFKTAFSSLGDSVLIETYISMKNPLIQDSHGRRAREMMFDNTVFGKEPKNPEALKAFEKDSPYDGVIIKNTNEGTLYIPRKSEQIKSTDNNGSFDKNNPDIRKSKMLVVGMKQAHQKLADKHGVSLAQIEKELKIGQKEELEHTSDSLEAHKIAMDHLKEDPEYYKKLSSAGLVEKSISDTKFGKEFKKMFSDEEGKINIYKNQYKLKDVKGFPNGLDLENCDILYIRDDKAMFSAGGDWQQSVNFGIQWKNGKMEVCDLFYENGKDNKSSINKYFKELNTMEKSKQDKVAQVMREFKEGTLTSHGKPVTNRKQALAIAMSEAGISKSRFIIKNGRLKKAKYITRKRVGNKWVYKYSEPSKRSAERKPAEMIPANKFNAGDYFTKTNDPNATPETIMKNAPPEVKAKIAATEAKLKKITPTINKHRQSGEGAAAVYSPERQKIHESIIMKMLSPEKMSKAMPEAGKQPTFTMLGGRGGSGKSWFNGKVYDPDKTIVMDSDEIKGQLPEYEGWNAFEVHEESSDILEKAVAMAKEYGLNIVIDATMKTTSSAVDRVLDFKKAGYDIKAHYMHAPRQVSAQRAVKRFGGKSGRYVPVGVVLSNVSNEKTFDAVKGYASEWSFRDSSVNPPPDLISKKNGGVIAKAMKNDSKSVKSDPHDMYDFGPVTDTEDYSPDLKDMIEKNRPGTVKKSKIVIRGISGKK